MRNPKRPALDDVIAEAFPPGPDGAPSEEARAYRQAVAGMVEHLIRTGPEMLARRHDTLAGFDQRLHQVWGEALDLFEMVVAGVYELGSAFHMRNETSAGEAWLYAALVRLHARACLTAAELHTLLSHGSRQEPRRAVGLSMNSRLWAT